MAHLICFDSLKRYDSTEFSVKNDGFEECFLILKPTLSDSVELDSFSEEKDEFEKKEKLNKLFEILFKKVFLFFSEMLCQFFASHVCSCLKRHFVEV